MAEKPAAQDDGAASGPVILAGRYSIKTGRVLAEFSSSTAQAFSTDDRRDSGRALFTLVVNPGVPVRVNVMRNLKGVQHNGLLQLVDWGTVFWPPAGRVCMCVVYERPSGGKVMATMTTDIRRIDEFEAIKRVVAPLGLAVKELASRGVTHRAINPTNLYWMSPDHSRIVIGDCVTAPPAFHQPTVVEPIPSIMCQPAGRGSGHYSDDLYSLGATLGMLLLGRNPVANWDEETLLRQKIAQGSYATLMGDERLPLAMIEVLRGLLCDDVDERWTIESFEQWLLGRRLSPLQPKLEKRASRAFPFGGEDFLTARELSLSFARNWDAAVPPVQDGRLELWLRRALEDKEKAAPVSEVVRAAADTAPEKRIFTDMMLAKVIIFLDHNAPLRYKGFNCMPDGMGTILAMTLADKGDVRLFAEVVLREIPRLWFEAREKYSPEYSLLGQHFLEMKRYLELTSIGNGMERCLYEMNEALPCQSSLLSEEYVLEIRELLPALDRAAKKADAKSLPIDRHIVAFIASRATYDISRQLVALADSRPDQAAIGMLNLLALLQWRTGNEPMPNLAPWVAGHMAPVVSSYHSREKRREIEKELPRLVRNGSLIEMSRMLDNPDQRLRDVDGFRWAQAEWLQSEKEARRLQTDKEARDEDAERVGKQSAALISAVVALLTVTITVIMQLF